jgi:hypothetical protein
MTGYMLEIEQASVTVAGNALELEQVSHNELQRIDLSGYTGYPCMFAIFGEQVRLYPKPAAGTTYQVDLDGTKRLATLSASTDTNEWLDEGLDLIAARVEKNLCARNFKDYQAAQVYQVAETEALARLEDRTNALVGGGRLKANW